MKKEKMKGRTSFTVVVTLVIALTVTNIVLLARRDEPYNPFGKYPVPQKVLNKTVQVGGVVYVDATKCFRGDEPVPLRGLSYWIRQDSPRTSVKHREGSGVQDPRSSPDGCLSFHYANQLPPEVGPGAWRLEGQECAQRGRETACVGWYTETFTVTNA